MIIEIGPEPRGGQIFCLIYNYDPIFWKLAQNRNTWKTGKNGNLSGRLKMGPKWIFLERIFDQKWLGLIRPQIRLAKKWVSQGSAKLIYLKPGLDFVQFWPKILILVKNRIFGQKLHFWSKSAFFSKIEILAKNWKFLQKSKYWTKIEIVVNNQLGNDQC
mgnify:CR=1 FL=1